MPLPVKSNITKCCWGSSAPLSNLVVVSDSGGSVSAYDIRTRKVAHTMKVQGGVMDMEVRNGEGRKAKDDG